MLHDSGRQFAMPISSILPGLIVRKFYSFPRLSIKKLAHVGWVRRGFLRRNPTNPILLLNAGLECRPGVGLVGYAIKPLTHMSKLRLNKQYWV